jgi:hypothetical protein
MVRLPSFYALRDWDSSLHACIHAITGCMPRGSPCCKLLPGRLSDALQVCCAGGSLQGGTLTGSDVDLDTAGGDIRLGRLMGTRVQVSGEDTATGAANVGSIAVGAIYAESLVMKTGARWRHACMHGRCTCLV